MDPKVREGKRKMNVAYRLRHIAIGASALILTAGLQQPAFAVALDFAAEAAGNERAVADGTTINFDGLNVTFSADNGFAYFDDVDQGRPAGLGVCPTFTTSCGGEDNISTDMGMSEAATLSFDGPVSLSDLEFRDALHFVLDGDKTLLIDGMQYTFGEASGATFLGIDMITFAYGGDSPAEFYVRGATGTPTNVIPLPASALLLLGALGGLGVVGRRRKAA
jgi:hypothetical protein